MLRGFLLDLNQLGRHLQIRIILRTRSIPAVRIPCVVQAFRSRSSLLVTLQG
jgi:hypothetical protein